MELELRRLEREERRRRASAELAFERIARQQRFMSRTGMMAIGAIAFCLVSLLLIAYESATSFASLFTAAEGEENPGLVILAAIGIVVLFLLALAAFGVYLFIWSARKRKWLQQEEEILRTELEGLTRRKEDLRQQLEQG